MVIFGGVSVESDFPSSDFVRVSLIVLLQHQDLIRDDLIRKGTSLMDATGQTVGKTVADFKPLLVEDHASGKTLAFIRGYIPKASIDPSSVLEYELDTLVQNTQGICDAKLLFPHINKFKYQHCLDYEGFTSFIKYDAEPISSPGIRAVLVFQTNKLFAIIHPNTIKSSHVFPFRKDALVIQYFTTDKARIRKFDEGFYFQFKSAG